MTSLSPENVEVPFPNCVPNRFARFWVEKLEFITVQSGRPVTFEENLHTLHHTQSLEHPRLQSATRRLEIWKHELRARLTSWLNRLPSPG